MVDDNVDNTAESAPSPPRSLNVRWSDPMAALALAATMTREELLAAFTSPDFPKPPIADLLGFKVLEAEPGRVVLGLQPKEYHCNAMGTVAAGVTATVLDAAMWIASQTSAPDNTLMSTVGLNMHLVRQLATTVDHVRAEANVVHSGRTTGTAESRLVDAGGKLYAHATASLVALNG